MTIDKRRAQTRKGKGGNLHERIARGIGERILSGEFAPGMLLPNEEDWGRFFRVSRTVVREAIKTLTAKGLIRSRPKIGSRVEPRARWNLLDRNVLDWHHAAMDRLSFLQSTQEARRILEPGIAVLAARKHTPKQLERIIAALEGMKKARSNADLVLADVEFHEALLAAANNDLLMPFGIIIEKALSQLFDYTSSRNPRPKLALKLHENVARAVAAADETGAHDAMLALLRDTDAIIAARGKRK